MQDLLRTDLTLTHLQTAKADLLNKTMPEAIIIGDNGVKYEYSSVTKKLITKVEGYIEERRKHILSLFCPTEERLTQIRKPSWGVKE